MINETINETITGNTITFEQWTQLTTSVEFILAILIIWIVPLIIYFIVGAIARGKSSSGQVYSKRMIEYPNFFYGAIIWFFIQAGLILAIVIFPLWLKLWGGT